MLIGPVLDAGDDGIVGFDVFLTMEVFAVSVKYPPNRIGAFLLRYGAGTPTQIAPALLVTFVQNRYNCSSPPSSCESLYNHRRQLLTFVADATCVAEFNSSYRRVSAVYLVA